MELSHAFNDSLVCLLVSGEMEGRVFLGKLDEASAHLLQVYLTLWLNSDLDHRVRELQQVE